MLLFICPFTTTLSRNINFNTSHVTVYRTSLVKKFNDMSFQYISCYCLSSATHHSPKIYRYFNTSHVTVYRLVNRQFIMELMYFNTSHVTVYPGGVIWVRRRLFISIHLMLLFIFIALHILFWITVFQYISCYCLSAYEANVLPLN